MLCHSRYCGLIVKSRVRSSFTGNWDGRHRRTDERILGTNRAPARWPGPRADHARTRLPRCVPPTDGAWRSGAVHRPDTDLRPADERRGMVFRDSGRLCPLVGSRGAVDPQRRHRPGDDDLARLVRRPRRARNSDIADRSRSRAELDRRHLEQRALRHSGSCVYATADGRVCRRRCLHDRGVLRFQLGNDDFELRAVAVDPAEHHGLGRSGRGRNRIDSDSKITRVDHRTTRRASHEPSCRAHGARAA